MYPNITIIILNWNGWEDTLECLESVYQCTYQNYHVLLVDNASEDDSLSKIREYCNGNLSVESNYIDYNHKNKPIELIDLNLEDSKNYPTFDQHGPDNKLFLIKNDKNYGFAEGNNIAMKWVIENFKSEYLLLLNNDTVINKKFLNPLIDAAEKNENIGFAGPKIYSYNSDKVSNVISFAGGELNLMKCQPKPLGVNSLDNGKYNTLKIVDYAEGSCLLVKTDMIGKIGFLNSEYFTYWEEIDWCVRGKSEGYNTIYVPQSMIWHKGYSSDLNARSIYMMIKNRFLFMKNNLKGYQIIIAVIYYYFYYYWILFFSFGILHKNRNKLAALFRGSIEGTKKLFK